MSDQSHPAILSPIFISYSHEDKSYRETIVQQLEAKGLKVWTDINIESGSFWFSKIKNQLNDCSALIVVLTDRALESHWITYEWAWALGNNIPVIPLIADSLSKKLHEALAECQWEDISKDLQIPKKTIQLLQHYQNSLPAYLQPFMHKIYDNILPLLTLSKIFIWGYEFRCSNIIGFNEYLWLFKKTHAEAMRVFYEKLYDFQWSMPISVPRRIEKCYLKIFEALDEFERLLSNLTNEIQFPYNHKNMRQKFVELENFYNGHLSQSVTDFGFSHVFLEELQYYLSNSNTNSATLKYHIPLAIEAVKKTSNAISKLPSDPYLALVNIPEPDNVEEFLLMIIEKCKQHQK